MAEITDRPDAQAGVLGELLLAQPGSEPVAPQQVSEGTEHCR